MCIRGYAPCGHRPARIEAVLSAAFWKIHSQFYHLATRNIFLYKTRYKNVDKTGKNTQYIGFIGTATHLEVLEWTSWSKEREGGFYFRCKGQDHPDTNNFIISLWNIFCVSIMISSHTTIMEAQSARKLAYSCFILIKRWFWLIFRDYRNDLHLPNAFGGKTHHN